MKLINDLIELRLVPEFGARITNLIDRRSGRDWIIQGETSGSGEDTAIFRGASARGWDECFPSVATCRSEAWGGPVRDHGALWGRPWECTASKNRIAARFIEPRFVFSRALSLQGATLICDYSLQSTHNVALPWIWSQHCLLKALPGETFSSSGLSGWKGADGEAFTPGPILPPSASVAGKYMSEVQGPVNVGLSGPHGGISFRWSSENLRHAGLWIDYGAWPPEAPDHQVAIEPTTSAFGSLQQAETAGGAELLLPNQMYKWRVFVELLAPRFRHVQFNS